MINKGIVRDFELAQKVLDSGTPKVNNLMLLTPGSGSSLSSISLQPIVPAGSGDVSLGPTIVDMMAEKAARVAEYEAEMRRRYDYALSTPLSQLTAEGIFVSTDNGSLFKKTTDAERQGMLIPADAQSWLALDWLQKIENEKGTPGALLMHMQQPELAKDTAGFEGGGSGTWGGGEPKVEPIPEVQNLPPVVKDGDTVTFTEQPTDTTNLGGTGTGTGTSLQSIAGGGKYWWLWYVVAIAAVIIYIKFIRK